jgi:hypothetical protein
VPAADTLPPGRGLTPRQVARLLRISPDRVRAMIVRGELEAIDVSAVRCGRPRYIVLPQHLEEFTRRRSAAPPPKPARRRRQSQAIDYYPDE